MSQDMLAGRMMIVAETEGRVYPGTVYEGLDRAAYDERMMDETEAGSNVLRAIVPTPGQSDGIVHVCRDTWGQARVKILDAGATIISEHPEDGYFLCVQDAEVASAPLEVLAQSDFEQVKILPAEMAEQVTITIPNPGPGPILIRRITVEGVRLPEG